MTQIHKLLRWDNRMMIRYLRIIYKSELSAQILFLRCHCKLTVRSCTTCLQTVLDRRNNVFAQISGIRSRIGQHLMILIQSLHDIQRLFRRISKPLIGFSLQLCQIIQKQCIRFFRCFFNLFHYRFLSIQLFHQSGHFLFIE